MNQHMTEEENDIYSSKIEFKPHYDEREENFEVDETKISKNMSVNSDYLRIEDFSCNLDPSGEVSRYNKFVESFFKKENKENSDALSKLNEILQKESFDNIKGQTMAGRLSSIERLVESTYREEESLKNLMLEQFCNLEKIIAKWRQIGGDGNCYYRTITVGFLESIVFEKNTILLKKIMSDIHEKFTPGYYNLERLPPQLKTDILKIKKKVILNILYLLHFFLEKSQTNTFPQSEQERFHKLAYEIMLKSFNLAKDFDIGLVFYFRFSLYEYILANHDKMLHKDFPVPIGNLLPFEYETDDGKFLWESYFKDHLLKLGTCAEKIVIYLTPYVWKLNVKLLIYDYGKDYLIETKKFDSHLKNRHEIVALYRKCHYDLAYSSKYAEKHKKFMDIFANTSSEERLKVLKPEEIYAYKDFNRTFTDNDYETMQSVCFTNKKIEKKAPPKEKEAEVKSQPQPPSIEKMNEFEKNSPFEQKPEEFIEDINSFYEPEPEIKQEAKALSDSASTFNVELVEKLKPDYRVYLEKSKELYKAGKFVQIMHIKNELLRAFSKDRKEAIKEIGFMKSLSCLMCFKNLDKKVKLPCECHVCSKECFNEFYSMVFGKISQDDSNVMCLCSTLYNGEELRKTYSILMSFEKHEEAKKILSRFTTKFIKCCLKCSQTVSIRDSTLFKKILLKDDEILKTFHFKKFSHKICLSCYSQHVRSTTVPCFICALDHEVINI